MHPPFHLSRNLKLHSTLDFLYHCLPFLSDCLHLSSNLRRGRGPRGPPKSQRHRKYVRRIPGGGYLRVKSTATAGEKSSTKFIRYDSHPGIVHYINHRLSGLFELEPAVRTATGRDDERPEPVHYNEPVFSGRETATLAYFCFDKKVNRTKRRYFQLFFVFS